MVNRKKVFLGEHIVATLKIYSRVNLSGIQEVRFPDFNSFLKEDLETPQLRTLERENVGGQIYNTGVLQRFLIYPQKTGILEIDAATLTVLIQQRVKSRDPFFGDFFSSMNSVPKMIATSPVEIEVKALPAGKPESFSGTVGNISVMSQIDNDTIDVNDALTYKIRLNGEGNLKLALAPVLSMSPDIEVYDPKIISNFKTSSSGTNGTRLFEYLFIPRHHGLYTIPPLEYSFFNPDLDKYITLKTSGHKFYVKKNENKNQKSQVYGGVTREDITYLGKDIRYIKEGRRTLEKNREMLISKSSFFIFYLSSLLIFILIIVWRREHVKRNSDLIKMRNRKAGKIAVKRLKQASVYLKKQLQEELYSELLKALWGYLSDKLGIPISDLTKESALKGLSVLNVSDTTQKQVSDIIDMCEYSRYSPEDSDSSLSDAYNLAEKVIKEIEKQI
ncbi:MAG: BatD family protein [Bacteroidales bacterium]|nr:BatD family protein [Bacteroidales bacterium]